MIQVPRELVRRCAAELADTPKWKRRPCSSLKMLIYGLNTIWANFPFLKYGRGFPQPSVAVRELEGLRDLARRPGGSSSALRRLETLIARDTDSYGLLLFQAALLIDKKAPERALIAGRALILLREIARHRPKQLADLAALALAGVRGISKRGRGGNRNRGALIKR